MALRLHQQPDSRRCSCTGRQTSVTTQLNAGMMKAIMMPLRLASLVALLLATASWPPQINDATTTPTMTMTVTALMRMPRAGSPCFRILTAVADVIIDPVVPNFDLTFNTAGGGTSIATTQNADLSNPLTWNTNWTGGEGGSSGLSLATGSDTTTDGSVPFILNSTAGKGVPAGTNPTLVENLTTAGGPGRITTVSTTTTVSPTAAYCQQVAEQTADIAKLKTLAATTAAAAQPTSISLRGSYQMLQPDTAIPNAIRTAKPATLISVLKGFKKTGMLGKLKNADLTSAITAIIDRDGALQSARKSLGVAAKDDAATCKPPTLSNVTLQSNGGTTSGAVGTFSTSNLSSTGGANLTLRPGVNTVSGGKTFP